MFTELIRKYKLNTTFDKILKEKEKILFRLLEKDVRPTKGVIELLHELKQMKLKLGIASSAHERLIDYILERSEIKQLFDSVISAGYHTRQTEPRNTPSVC